MCHNGDIAWLAPCLPGKPIYGRGTLLPSKVHGMLLVLHSITGSVIGRGVLCHQWEHQCSHADKGRLWVHIRHLNYISLLQSRQKYCLMETLTTVGHSFRFLLVHKAQPVTFWIIATTEVFKGHIKTQLCRPWCPKYVANCLRQSKQDPESHPSTRRIPVSPSSVAHQPFQEEVHHTVQQWQWRHSHIACTVHT